MPEHVRSSFCRYCAALCAIEVTVRDGRPVKVIGDAADPAYHGYSCVKGRQLPDQHNSPDRLLGSLRRGTHGNFEPIESTRAIDEVAEKIRESIDRYGPRSVAVYQGTHGMAQPVAAAMSDELMRRIGSPMIFNPIAIDQPGKILATGMAGRWHGGTWHLHQLDALMLIGTNPVVSMWAGTFVYNPTRQLREARARGMKLVVVDPRVTETARVADLHLRPRPGEDVTVVAGLVRAIIVAGRHDTDFVDAHVSGFDALRRAVEPFDPDYVERRTGVPARDLLAAAEIMSSTRRGATYAGTGTNMAPRGTLAEYLVSALFSVCGHYLREGDPVANPGTLLPPRSFEARAVAAKPTWDVGEELRSVPLRGMKGSMPTAQLADEILHDGPDRIRVLINWAGNPMVAIPDQLKLADAFDRLDLLVSIDPRMTATSRRSHYVIAPKLSLEMASVTWFHERSEAYLYPTANAYPMPYVHYTPAVVDPPEGADVIDDWTFFHGVAARLGHALPIGGELVDPEFPPTSEELLAQFFTGSVVPFDEISASDKGQVFDRGDVRVTAPSRATDARLEVGYAPMLDELTEVAAEPLPDPDAAPADQAFGFRLISRREFDVYNSTGQESPKLTRSRRYNPAHVHPDDLTAIGVRSGDLVEITSERASIVAVAEASPDILPGVISMAHCWGDTPDRDADVRTIGSSTGRLTDNLAAYDPRSGIPTMSAIPVRLGPAPAD